MQQELCKVPLIFHSFLNEINVLIYQDGFVFDFLACTVISGTQKPISSAQTLLESYFMLVWTENLTKLDIRCLGGFFALEIDWWKG